MTMVQNDDVACGYGHSYVIQRPVVVNLITYPSPTFSY